MGGVGIGHVTEDRMVSALLRRRRLTDCSTPWTVIGTALESSPERGMQEPDYLILNEEHIEEAGHGATALPLLMKPLRAKAGKLGFVNAVEAIGLT